MTGIKRRLKPFKQQAQARVVRIRERAFGGRMEAPERLHEFWRQSDPEMNLPSDYVAAVGRSQALLELVKDLPPAARVLEVGCNVGRNLALLHDAGHQVTGVEISSNAVAQLRDTYPQLAESDVLVGAAEDVLPTMPDDSFDLVFTMAVIEHIHPDSTRVFDRIASLAPRFLAIEPPGTSSHRQAPHDVPRLFEARGMRLVSKIPMRKFEGTRDDPAINWYDAYQFERVTPDA